MKITLINPPFIFPSAGQITFSQCLGVRSLASYIHETGSHEVIFLDSLFRGFKQVRPYGQGVLVGLETDEIVRQIMPDSGIVGISVPFSQLAPIAHEIATEVKKKHPDIPLVMGGVYPSTQPRLALTSSADFIVVGEGEMALGKLANRADPRSIPGVYSRADINLETFSPAEMIENLDDIPFPDYTAPAMNDYFSLSPRRERGKIAALVTSRGCPFACEFCSIHPVYGRKWRARSASHVLEEVDMLVKQFGVTSLEIEDDNFTLRADRTIAILEGFIRLQEKGHQLTWRTPNGVRIDTLNKEIIALMKRSRCEELVLALEHGDEEMLGIMNKQLHLDTAYNVAKMAVACDIPKITFFVIVGYPGETRERFERGLHYLHRLHKLGNNLRVCVNIAQPYPGTRLLERCRKEGFLADPETGNFLRSHDFMSTAQTVSILTPDFDQKEVQRRYNLVRELFDPKWKKLLRKIIPDSAISALTSFREMLRG